MSNSGLSPGSIGVGRVPPTDKTCVVSTRRQVQINWFSDRTLQPSNKPVVASSSVPSDFFVEGRHSGLGSVHPLMTFYLLQHMV